MKFGKNIAAQQELHADLHYLDYKLLKKRIKDIIDHISAGEWGEALTANSAFEHDLSGEVARVNDCFNSNRVSLLGRAVGVADALREAQDVSNSVVRDTDSFQEFVDVLQAMDRLRKYAVWNCVAVVKILKKRRKQTSFGNSDVCQERVCWLSQQSFFNGSQFAEMHAVAQSVGEFLVTAKFSQDKMESVDTTTNSQHCPICLDSISDAVELACKHRFCWKCFVLGPIAFQPGEYRFSQCPICRSDPKLDTRSADPCAAADAQVFSGGMLTRFLHTYFKDEHVSDQQALECKRKTEETDMQDAIGELIRVVLDVSEWQHPPNAQSGVDGYATRQHDDFFETLPQKPVSDSQTGATQKLMWLQQASSGDALAIDSGFCCTLCSEMLATEAVVTTPCKHYFHRVCISRLQTPHCPLCSETLPFSWFLPENHPCAESGFNVILMQDYKPAFPGGPSLGSGGFPLHAPPPMHILGPGGIRMKSYLHKASPTTAIAKQEENCSEADELAESSSSGSSSSSECSSRSGEDEDCIPTGDDRKRYVYTAVGRIRLCSASEHRCERSGICSDNASRLHDA